MLTDTKLSSTVEPLKHETLFTSSKYHVNSAIIFYLPINISLFGEQKIIVFSLCVAPSSITVFSLYMCVAPSSITAIPQARTATISWTSVGSTFTVTYGVRGGMSNMTITVGGTTAILTGLSPVTAYDVEIRGIDSMGRQGEVGITNFTTFPTG